MKKNNSCFVVLVFLTELFSFISGENHLDARFKLKVYICVFQDPI